MKVGNLSQTVWRRSVLKQLHIEKERQVLLPVPGERCNAENTGEDNIRIRAHAAASGKLVTAAKYAVFQALNDVACRGAMPESVDLQVLFPVSAEEEDVRTLVCEMQKLCEQLGVHFDGFQAQVNPAVERVIATVTVSGVISAPEMSAADGIEAEDGLRAANGAAAAKDLRRSQAIIRMQDARAGLEIVMCGFVGLEGSLRIAAEHRAELEKRFVPAFLRQMDELEIYLNQAETIQKAIQVARSRMAAFHIFAIQQAAGGAFAALWELAEAAGIGLEVDLKKMPICQETVEICEYYQLNPYQMTSAGCILFLTDNAEKLIEILEESGARAERLGVTTAGNARVITSGEEQRYLERPAPDEWMRFLERELHEQQNPA